MTGQPNQAPEPLEERLLTPAEVAAMFRVDPKTVSRWAKDGKITSIRTVGGHRRYRESEVTAFYRGKAVPNGSRRLTGTGQCSRCGQFMQNDHQCSPE